MAHGDRDYIRHEGHMHVCRVFLLSEKFLDNMGCSMLYW